jgi:uncharacterized protein (TIGR02996 family)
MDDTPKLVMADWQDDHGSPVVAAMYRHAVHMARISPDGDRGTILTVRDHATPHDAAALSRHAAMLSSVGYQKRESEDFHTLAFTSGFNTAVNRSVRLATDVVKHGAVRDAGRGNTQNRHGTAAYYHSVLADTHHPETGIVQDAISHYANRYAAAVHRHLAEQK